MLPKNYSRTNELEGVGGAKSTVVVVLDISWKSSLYSGWSKRSFEEQLGLTIERIKKICGSLLHSHPDSEWIFAWREYGLTDSNSRYININQKAKLKAQLSELTLEYSNLTIISGTVATKRKLNVNNLSKILGTYTAEAPAYDSKQFEGHKKQVQDQIDQLNNDMHIASPNNDVRFVVRNTSYIFKNGGVARHDKTTPFDETTDLKDSIFQRAKGRNKPAIFYEKNKYDIGVEICFEHFNDVLKNEIAEDKRKPLIHFVLSDSIRPDYSSIVGKYFVHIDSQYSPYFVRLSREDDDNSNVLAFVNDLLGSSDEITPLHPLGITAIMQSIIHNSLDEFQKLYSGLSQDERKPWNSVILRYAIIYNTKEIIEALSRQNVQVEAIHVITAKKYSIEVLNILLDMPTSLSQKELIDLLSDEPFCFFSGIRKILLKCTAALSDNNGNTILHTLSLLSGDLLYSTVRLAINILSKFENFDINIKNNDGKSPLDLAYENGNYKLVDLFIANKAKIDRAALQSINNEMTLMNFNILKEKLKYSDFDLNATYDNNETLLLIASKKNFLGAFMVLLNDKRLDRSCKNSSGQDYLDLIIAHEDFKLVDYLISKGITEEEESRIQLINFEKAVAAGGNTNLIIYLLAKGADPNRREAGGKLLLNLYLSCSSEDSINIILNTGKFEVNYRDNDEMTALDYELSRPTLDEHSVLLLLNHGANPLLCKGDAATLLSKHPNVSAEVTTSLNQSITLHRGSERTVSSTLVIASNLGSDLKAVLDQSTVGEEAKPPVNEKTTSALPMQADTPKSLPKQRM